MAFLDFLRKQKPILNPQEQAALNQRLVAAQQAKQAQPISGGALQPSGVSQRLPQNFAPQLESLRNQAEQLQATLQSQQAQQQEQPQVAGDEELRKAEERIRSAQFVRRKAEEVGPEERETEQTLQNLLASKELGLTAIKEKPIALPFITGQQAALERRAATLASPLQARLSQLQARRQAGIGSAKLGVEEAEQLKDIEKARFERGKPKEKTQTEKDRALKTEVIKVAFPKLQESRGRDGYVDPSIYLDLRRQYSEVLGDPSNFDDVFSPMLSPQERARLFTEKSVAAARAPKAPSAQKSPSGSKLDEILKNL